MVYQPREMSRQSIYKKHGRGLESAIFDCGSDGEQEYIIRIGNDSACVLAITVEQQVILAKQFRFGPQKILLELPGGCIDNNENPEQAVVRELLEETGYAGDVMHVIDTQTDGYSPTQHHYFVATNCKKVAEQNLDDTEDIEVVLMSLHDFRMHLRSGALTDVSAGYLGLDYLGLL